MQEHCMMSLQMDTRLSHKPQLFRALIFHFAVATLLLTHPHGGRSQQIGQPQPVVAMVGDDTTLPCHVKPATDAVNVMVEWSRRDLQPRFVHMRRSGEDRLIDQNPSYSGRTSVSIDGLKQGDTSLRLSKVKLSDEGTYRCFVPDLDTDSSVKLVVEMIKITRFSSGVLECKYSGSYPESELLWLDSEGKRLSAGPTETVRGPDGLYTVSSNLTVEKGHSNNFTCRAQEKRINQITEKQINVPDDYFSDSSSSSAPVIIGVVVAIMAILAVVFGVWKWKQPKSKAGSYNTDEENGGKRKKNSTSTESEQESLIKPTTEHNTAPSPEETNTGTADEGVKDGDGHQNNEIRGEAKTDKEENKEQTTNTNSEPVTQGPTDEGVKEHNPPVDRLNNLGSSSNSKDTTKPVSEDAHTPAPSDPDTSQDKPEKTIDPKNGDKGTKSVNTGTEGQGVKDGGGQQQDTTGGGANTNLNVDGNKEQKQTAGQSPSDERVQENDTLVNDNKDTLQPPEGGGEQAKNSDSKDGVGDTTPTNDTHNTTSTSPETKVQSLDKEDKDKEKNSTDNGPADQASSDEGMQGNDSPAGAETNGNSKKTAEPDPKGKDTPQTAEGGHEEKTPDSKDGGDSTTSQSALDEAPDQLVGADGQNDSLNKDENKTNSANNKTAGQALTAGEGRQDGHRTGDEKNNKEDNNSLSNQTGPPSSENTETGIKVQTEEQEIRTPC